jgi:hypothetical protein
MPSGTFRIFYNTRTSQSGGAVSSLNGNYDGTYATSAPPSNTEVLRVLRRRADFDSTTFDQWSTSGFPADLGDELLFSLDSDGTSGSLRVDAIGECVELNGAGSLIAFNDLPAGFVATSARLRIVGHIGGDSMASTPKWNFSHELVSFGGTTAAEPPYGPDNVTGPVGHLTDGPVSTGGFKRSYEISFASPAPKMLDLVNAGFIWSWSVPDTGGSDVVALRQCYIEGEYFISSDESDLPDHVVDFQGERPATQTEAGTADSSGSNPADDDQTDAPISAATGSLANEVNTAASGDPTSDPTLAESWHRLDATFLINPQTNRPFTLAELASQKYGAIVIPNDAYKVDIDRIALTVEYWVQYWWYNATFGWYTRRATNPFLGPERVQAPAFDPLYAKPLTVPDGSNYLYNYPTLPPFLSAFKGITYPGLILPPQLLSLSDVEFLDYIEINLPDFRWQVVSDAPADPHGWWFSTAAFGGDVAIVNDGRPKDPRAWAKITAFATGDAKHLGGFPGPAAVYDNRLIYASDDYTLGTTYPPVRAFDGTFDRELCQMPPTTTGTKPKAILSMLTANGKVYLSTLDAGSSSSDWIGRVFELTPETGALVPLGDPFTTGYLPYSLAWHTGRLWCGLNRQNASLPGRVYSFRPGISSTWTLEHDLTTNTAGGVCSMLSFNGDLYVGTDAPADTGAQLLKRASADSAWSSVLTPTATIAYAEQNGIIALAEYAGKLFASYWNNNSATVQSEVQRYDVDTDTWSTVYSGVDHTAKPFLVIAVDSETILAIGGSVGRTAALVRSDDGGDTWIDVTDELPESDKAPTPAFAVLVL